jgi:putative ABC transport system permease protein
MWKWVQSLCRNLFRKAQVDQALEDEVQATVQILFQEKLRKGFTPSEARRQALIELGGTDQVKEDLCTIRAGRWLEDLYADLRFGLRILARNPNFSIVAIITLALGIGATTVIFSVVDTVVLRQLPYPESDRLMAILSTSQNNKNGFSSAPGVFLDWRDRSTSFEMMAGVRLTSMDWTGVGQTQTVSITKASTDLFPLLGVKPVLGRLFGKDEDLTGRKRIALLDYGFCVRHFDGSADVLGRSIILSGMSYEIVGILPSDIRFDPLRRSDVYLPIAANPAARFGGDVIVVGRLRPGVTLRAAQAEMDAVMHGIGRDHIDDSRTGVLIKPLQNWIVGDMRQVFLVILGAAAFLMLICCANIANLLLTRATTRQREMAIRTSLGANRLRLVRQTLAESFLLSSIGGVFGFGLAALLIPIVTKIRAFRIPRIQEIAVDHSVFLIAMILSLATGVLFGIAPALQVRHIGMTPVLRAQASWQPKGRQLRNALVVLQLALALILLAGAGLMTNSLLRLLNIDLGFERSNIITINCSFSSQKYDFNRTLQFQRQLAAQVKRMPGVEEVSASDYLPLMAVLFPMNLHVAGEDADQRIKALARHIDPNYLRVFGVPLLRGRDLTWSDDKRKPVPVLISRNAAKAVFGLADPLGRHMLSGYRDLDPLEVVGIVGDVHQLGVTEEAGSLVYLPLAQSRSAQYVVARTSRDAGDLAVAIRSTVHTLDPELPAPVIGSLDDWYDRELAKPRFYLILVGAFAALGIILAAVGIYGVISYGVALRTQEIGIRVALGAEQGDIMRLVLGGGLKLVCIGIVLGLAGALALTRLLSTLLFKVRPNDPLTFACTVMFLAGIAMLACYLAARKAVTIDPNRAIRCE